MFGIGVVEWVGILVVLLMLASAVTALLVRAGRSPRRTDR
jgi:hypothetical protein